MWFNKENSERLMTLQPYKIKPKKTNATKYLIQNNSKGILVLNKTVLLNIECNQLELIECFFRKLSNFLLKSLLIFFVN